MPSTDAPDLGQRIADRVRELRAAQGQSLDALAAACGVSRSMISLIERGETSPTAVVLEKLAAGLGVTDGMRVRLSNARGTVVVPVRIATGQLPGTVVVEGVWPGEYFEEGIGINALTSDEPAPPMGGAVFHDTAVALERVGLDAGQGR